MDDFAAVERHTRLWLLDFVIEPGLCPFARVPFEGGRSPIVVSPAEEPRALALDLDEALRRVIEASAHEIETLLLVHPRCLLDFAEYNAFLDVADARVEAAGLVGVVQIASFHPDYRFAEAPPGDPANFTNRSPFPMLHLLREASVERALRTIDDPATIPRRNVATLRAMGTPAILARLAAIARAAKGEAACPPSPSGDGNDR